MHFIAIDLGTTFVKGAVLALDTLRLEHIRRAPFPPPLAGLPARRYELDPDAVTAVVRETVEALLPAAPKCAGIVLCTQMHSVVLVDAHGAARTNATTWLDQRVLDEHPAGGTYFDRLAARLGERARRRLGNELRPGLPIGTLFWLAEQGALPADAVPLTIADFALMQLCGAPPGIEPTNAAASGAFDVVAGAWDEDALARAGLGALAWPPVADFSVPVGVYRSHERAIPCYRPVGDAQCALVGAGLAEGELSINIATGSQVSLLRRVPQLGDYQTRPFFDGRALTTISGIPAGRALNVLVGLLAELALANGLPAAEVWPLLLRAAELAPDSELRVRLGFFGGAEGAQGAIEHIREGNLTAGGLFRAALREMAESYRAAAMRLAPEQDWTNLVLTGGLAQQARLLRELIAARFDAPYRLGPAEDTLIGLMALALVCAGRAADVAAAQHRVRDTWSSSTT
jgi:sugar (pentulose or hexulose) kinase